MQIFIKVNGVDKDIKFTTEAQREEYYLYLTHGMLASLTDKLLDELIKVETPFSEVAADER